MNGAWMGGLVVGVLWGAANAWCLAKGVRCVVTGQRRSRLAGWLAVKLIGLYGSLAFFLVVLRLSPLGWLAGFGLSMIGMAFGSYRFLVGLESKNA